MNEYRLMLALRRLVKLGAGALVGLLMNTQGAWGLTCPSIASASWKVATTWSGGGAGTPGSADAVVIAAAHAVAVDASSVAQTLSITAPSGATGGVTITGTNTLGVGGAGTLPTVGGNNRTSSLIVGGGTVTMVSIASRACNSTPCGTGVGGIDYVERSISTSIEP